MQESVARRRKLLWLKISIGIIGLLLSIVAHELFHVAMHQGNIGEVNFFRDGALVSMHVETTPGYDIVGEEEAAYGITLLVMLLTVIAICKVHDQTDQRTTRDILFPRTSSFYQIEPEKLFEIARRANITD